MLILHMVILFEGILNYSKALANKLPRMAHVSTITEAVLNFSLHTLRYTSQRVGIILIFSLFSVRLFHSLKPRWKSLTLFSHAI